MRTRNRPAPKPKKERTPGALDQKAKEIRVARREHDQRAQLEIARRINNRRLG